MSNRWRKNSKRARWDQSRPSIKRGSRPSLEGLILFIAKAIANFEKHRVPFEEAATVFGDSNALDWQDVAHSHQESRFKRLGLSVNRRLLLVVYTIRREHEKETI